MVDRNRSNTNDRANGASGNTIFVAIKDYIWVGVGSVFILIFFFSCCGIYNLGYRHGRNDERMLDVESVLTGQALSTEEACKWLQRNQTQQDQQRQVEPHQ